jgi:hypothetical protein
VKQSSQLNLGDRAPLVFVPLAQHYAPALTLHVRATRDAASLLPGLKLAVADLDPDLPVSTAMPLAEVARRALWAERAGTAALQAFALLALLLASIGVYGAASDAVGRRTREIGIRMALGARSRDVLRLVLTRSLTSIGLGLAIGLALGVGLAKAISSLLYGVGPRDPATMLLASLVLLSVGSLAAGVPGRRATCVDPAQSLRCE